VDRAPDTLTWTANRAASAPVASSVRNSAVLERDLRGSARLGWATPFPSGEGGSSPTTKLALLDRFLAGIGSFGRNAARPRSNPADTQRFFWVF
jgi:hypothetical protein